MEYKTMIKKWIFLGLLIAFKAQAENFIEGPTEPFSAEIENILLHSGTDTPLKNEIFPEKSAEKNSSPFLDSARKEIFNHLLHKKLYSSFPQVLSVPSSLKSLSEEKQILYSIFLEADEIPPYIHAGRELFPGSKESSTDFSFYNAAFDEYKARYQANKAEGALGLGILYREGLGVKKSPLKALSYFKEAASLNDPLALTSLGFFHHTGEMAPYDRSKAISYYEKASPSDQGGIAEAYLAEILLCTPISDQERAKGEHYLGRALDKNIPYAFLVKAYSIYYNIQHNPMALALEIKKENLEEALQWTEKAIEKGVKNAIPFQEVLQKELNIVNGFLEQPSFS